MANVEDIVVPKPIGQGLTDEVYADVLHSLKDDTSTLPSILEQLHHSDIADLLERLPIEDRKEVATFIPKDMFSDVLLELSEGVQEDILQDVDNELLGEVLSSLESDDAADIVQHLDDDRVEQALETISDEHSALVSYDEDSAGGLMQVEVVCLPASWTVAEALEYTRESDSLPKHLHTIYILGRGRKLKGTISLSRLVRLPLDKQLKDVMRTDPIWVTPDTEPNDVVRLFEKYDFYNCAVADEDGRLLGVIAIDDVLDVILEENEKRFMGAAGLGEGEDLFAPMRDTTRKRFPWLFINLITAILASLVIAQFSDAIERVVVLAVLMPIVASMGGNAGTQTLTVTVRGLALKHITFSNALTLLKKEVLVGGFNGLILGLMVGAGVMALYQDYVLGGVIFAATICNHLLAAISGHYIPIVLNKFGKDPAISSGVLLTTVTDVGGFFVFLGLATLFL